MPSATAITTTAATITAAVNAESDDTAWHFEWGRTTAYGTSTATVELPAGAVPQAVRVRLTGLAPATRYHFRIAAANSAGPSLGVDQTFTTKPKPKPKKKKPANR
jgi:phosphodiesterase/alkaline phosphatase D-like protein